MIPAGVRIYVCTQPVAIRYGFDRLAQSRRWSGRGPARSR